MITTWVPKYADTQRYSRIPNGRPLVKWYTKNRSSSKPKVVLSRLLLRLTKRKIISSVQFSWCWSYHPPQWSNILRFLYAQRMQSDVILLNARRSPTLNSFPQYSPNDDVRSVWCKFPTIRWTPHMIRPQNLHQQPRSQIHNNSDVLDPYRYADE